LARRPNVDSSKFFGKKFETINAGASPFVVASIKGFSLGHSFWAAKQALQEADHFLEGAAPAPLSTIG
jgi:hypothetical protein